jgi:hypothetical protein
VSTFRLGDFAEGINSVQKASHSGFSTHESGSPAEAVRRMSLSSNRSWRALVQVTSGLGVAERSAARPLLLRRSALGRGLEYAEIESEGARLEPDDEMRERDACPY